MSPLTRASHPPGTATDLLSLARSSSQPALPLKPHHTQSQHPTFPETVIPPTAIWFRDQHLTQPPFPYSLAQSLKTRHPIRSTADEPPQSVTHRTAQRSQIHPSAFLLVTNKPFLNHPVPLKRINHIQPEGLAIVKQASGASNLLSPSPGKSTPAPLELSPYEKTSPQHFPASNPLPQDSSQSPTFLSSATTSPRIRSAPSIPALSKHQAIAYPLHSMQFVYSPRYFAHYGPHVFPIIKYQRVANALRQAQIPETAFVEPSPATREQILCVHTPAYLDPNRSRRNYPAEQPPATARPGNPAAQVQPNGPSPGSAGDGSTRFRTLPVDRKNRILRTAAYS
jgi:hypothetical protein